MSMVISEKKNVDIESTNILIFIHVQCSFQWPYIRPVCKGKIGTSIWVVKFPSWDSNWEMGSISISKA